MDMSHTKAKPFKQTLRTFENIYLGYLSLLPAIGTFVFLQSVAIPGWLRLVVFVLGTAGVAIYLATLGSYTRFPKALWKRALLIVDGPFWVMMSLLFWHFSLSDIISRTFFVDVGSASLAVLIAVVVAAPTREDRRKGIIATVLPLLAILICMVIFMQARDSSVWQTLFLFAGVVQSGVTQATLVKQDRVQRNAEGFILFGLLSWTVFYIAGNALFG